MLSFKILEVVGNDAHIGFNVAGGYERAFADNGLCGKVYTVEKNGKFGFEGDIVETTFPFSVS